ncbi:hypothetical protein [Butyrivibrio sp. AE3006]|uniref:hypothetical protein n=1 Tax=Butyrivibrio sp. AE3006 TaxID=1280673 RepID=UPI000414B649|nr:hypothetical protein [Butyrivibrio sp. AE3006]
MSDENMNNNEGTSALFVSAQKKKQAEEEARKKAEEEKAKREAAEAEVRRMEQEVEERKRQAEEQAKAQAAAAAAATKAAPMPKPVKEKTGGKSKLPIFIGIGVAVVALIAIIAVVAGGGGKKIDYDTLECYGEYKSGKEGYDITVFYPDTLYTNVEESDLDNSISISFSTENSKDAVLFVSLKDLGITSEELAVAAKSCLESMVDFSKEMIGDEEITSEELTDLASGEPDSYMYKTSFKSADESVGHSVTWIEKNSEGHMVMSFAMTYQRASDTDNSEKVLELFKEKNLSDAVKIPGCNEPTDYDWDGQLVFSEVGVYIPMPKDRFKLLNEENGKAIYSDDNGAIIIAAAPAVGTTEEYTFTEETKDIAFMEFSDASETFDLSSIFNSDNRMFLNDTTDPFIGYDYTAEYRLNINDITYWERDYFQYWVKNDVVYMETVLTFVPEKNKDVYTTIFDRMLKESAALIK